MSPSRVAEILRSVSLKLDKPTNPNKDAVIKNLKDVLDSIETPEYSLSKNKFAVQVNGF
jgi:hypothetical protein